MTLYRNKYRIESARLKGWDYASNGHYFITICVKTSSQGLCHVIDGKIKLTETGKIIQSEWIKTGEMRKNIKLDEWIIMPDHFHAILMINNKINNPRNNLSNIIGGFKSSSTKRIHLLGYSDFEWLGRFHDHIIRNDYELARIRKYIMDNPEKRNKNHQVQTRCSASLPIQSSHNI